MSSFPKRKSLVMKVFSSIKMSSMKKRRRRKRRRKRKMMRTRKRSYTSNSLQF